MTAYGAVLSLKNMIHYILHSSHFTLVEPSPAIIKLAYKELQPLQEILERLDKTRTSRSRKHVNEVDGRIKDKIWELEDKLDSSVTDQILSQIPAEQEQVDGDGGIRDTTVWQSLPSEFEFQIPPQEERLKSRRSRDVFLFSIGLQCLQDDVASFIQELKDMRREYFYEMHCMPQEPISTTIGLHYVGTKPKMIGLSNKFRQIKRNLMRDYCVKYVHQIVGMAGIGKTALAGELYEDADIVSYYDCRAWVTVTRTMVEEGPHFDEVVQGILAQLCLCGDTLIQDIADYLEDKKCLVVLDDVWEQEVLHSLNVSLPDICNGIFNILVTSRGASLLADCTIETRFLNEEESKELLCHNVFGDQQLCPVELDKAATKIAKKCEGLPLMIVTVADILWKSHNTELEYWNDVAEERNSVFTDAYNEISKVLYPSYDYLPQYLKMSFLYMGAFPPGHEIPQSKLINMLNVEGWLLDTNRKESLEDFIWACFYQLCICRYLVLFKRKSVYWDASPSVSIYKTCRLHSSWHYVCREEARKNKFYHVLTKLVDASQEVAKGHRGLSLQNNILFSIKEFCNSVRLNWASFARSLLFFGPYHQYPIPIGVCFKFLRKLDALKLRFYTFPTEILTLVQLKYLALTCNGQIPTTISKLFNLQVLIVHPHMNIRCCRAPSFIPIQIWDMQELEHIEILGKSLRVQNHVVSLEKLAALVGVNASICTIVELSRRIPNIRKLVVRIELTPYDDHNDLLSCFACISTLGSLEILKYSIINPVIQYGYIVHVRPCPLMLPRGLRKLHLSGMGFPWEYMDAIGSLPVLEVLKLRSYAFRGSNWKAEDERFPRLRFLLIEDTDLVCLNLSRELTCVRIKHCYKLERIHWPRSSYGAKKIELVDCNPLAFTWAMELEVRGSFFVDVTISSSFEEKPIIINFKRFESRTIFTFLGEDDDDDDDEDDEDEDDDDELEDDEDES